MPFALANGIVVAPDRADAGSRLSINGIDLALFIRYIVHGIPCWTAGGCDNWLPPACRMAVCAAAISMSIRRHG